MAPTEARKIIYQRFRQVAFFWILHHADGTVPLRQALAIRAKNHWYVAEARERRAQGVKDINLARRVVDMVIAANDMGHVHVPVIHDYAEVVSRHAVAAQNHDVVQFLIADRNRPLDQIVPRYIACVWIAETHDWFHPCRWGFTFRIFRPPTTVVARFQPPRP